MGPIDARQMVGRRVVMTTADEVIKGRLLSVGPRLVVAGEDRIGSVELGSVHHLVAV